MGESAQLRIGTSGWVYKHWREIFYPAGLPGDQQLAFYAREFDTVEINYSYYQLPEKQVFEAWREQSPDGFLFAVKGSRFLTHMKKLMDPEEPLQRLMDRSSGLARKRGPILFQFPHTWRLHLERLEPFTELLGAYPGERFAFEFRHPDWLISDTYRLLERCGAALCLPVHPNLPLDIRLTAPWTYVRMHTGRYGTGYSDEELGEWAGHVRRFLGEGVDVYLYFNNDPGGHAIYDARRLRTMLA